MRQGRAEPRLGWHPSSEGLRSRVIACRRCPRLVAFREGVPARASYAGEEYWRKPVPGFGDLGGRLLVLGIAPAASGGNRTGRPFTGDSSGRFLVRALYECGFASQPASESATDGLEYRDCYVTAAVKCAPPGDKPSTLEFANCAEYLDSEIGMMRNLRVVLTLGALSFRAYAQHLSRAGIRTRGLSFGHGKVYRVEGAPAMVSCYHPSPRNTNTGKLTESMLVETIRLARRELSRTDHHPRA